jgi:hypothetical protein
MWFVFPGEGGRGRGGGRAAGGGDKMTAARATQANAIQSSTRKVAMFTPAAPSKNLNTLPANTSSSLEYGSRVVDYPTNNVAPTAF